MIAILILKNDTVEKYCKRKLEDFSNRRKENVRDPQIQRGAKAVSGYDGVRDGWIRHRTVELTREIERLAVSRQLCKLTRRLRGFLIFSHDVLIEPASTPLGELS